MSPKILVADIAAANDSDLSIGNEGLVVHPLVDASELGDHAKHPQRTHGYGVEHPHLDVGMTVDGEQGDVGGHRAEIVEQQTHAHAAVGRAEQTVEKNLARQVLVPDEILHIEAALRRIRQGQPRGQGVAPVRELVEAGLARMRGDARTHRRSQRGAAVAFHGRGRCAFAALGKTATCTQCQYH